MAKKKRSGTERSLYPVSERATRRALLNVVGGRTTDAAKYKDYQAQVGLRQPHLMGTFAMLADFRERSARIAKSEVPVQQASYMGGALIYLASVEEQARLFGRTIKKISDAEAKETFHRGEAIAASPQDAQDIVVGFYNEVPAEDIAEFISAPMAEKLKAQQAKMMKHADSAVASPLFQQLAPTIDKIATISFVAANTRMVKFLGEEPHFSATMSDWWWNDAHPTVAISQMLGASDANYLIMGAGVE